ncbi:MAG: transposase [Chloroflexota bacterium]
MTNRVPEMVLAIDFSLDRLDVCLRGDERQWRWAHQAYPNNWPGFQQLKQDLLSELNQLGPVRLTAVGESTGPYWWHAFYQFGHDEALQPFSPQLPSQPRPRQRVSWRSPSRQADPDDARLIDQYYRAVGVDHPYQFPDRYLRLRTFTRAYARVTHTLASEKAYLLSVLYLSEQDYQRHEEKPFSNLFGTTSLYVLDEFADIQAIAAIPLAALTTLLAQRSGHTFSDPQANASKLLRVAEHSYPIPAHLADALHQVIQHTLAHIHFLSDNQKAYRQLIEQELATLPEAKRARTLRSWPHLGRRLSQ